MQATTLINLTPDVLERSVVNSSSFLSYEQAEQQFTRLIELDHLDQEIRSRPTVVQFFESTLTDALDAAYGDNRDDKAHLFLQRILYRINRLKFFWYDDLRNYTNERSPYLQQVRDQIETAWQQWELAQIDLTKLQGVDVKQALIDRVAADLNPSLSEGSRFMRERMTVAGYKHLLSIASLDGLVEASRLSRILGGASNEVHCMLTRVLIEEYGGGRSHRKHSTFFAQMMADLGLSTEPEAYFDLVPWEVLASINHNFLLTECKRHFLRYCGGLTYFEVAGPGMYRDYLNAAQRLGLSAAAMGYWELHIKEDERHGQWMLDDVALPLVERYPEDAWELLLGYDQEKWLGDRAGLAVVRSIQNVERSMG